MSDIKVNVEGLKQFRKELRSVGSQFPKELRLANKAAASVVLPEAKRRAGQSRRNLAGGTARVGSRGVASIRILASQSKAQIAAGGARVPWMGGSNYGSSGRYRQFPAKSKDGYILWPAALDKRPQVVDTYDKMVISLARQAFPN